jgi:hypothetical protein
MQFLSQESSKNKAHQHPNQNAKTTRVQATFPKPQGMTSVELQQAVVALFLS